MAQGKESACNAGDSGDSGSIPGSARSPGGGNGNPPQYSYLENPLDRGAWQATVQRVAKSWTWLSNWTYTQLINNVVIVLGGHRRDSAIHTCIHFPPNSLPIHAATWHRAEFPVLRESPCWLPILNMAVCTGSPKFILWLSFCLVTQPIKCLSVLCHFSVKILLLLDITNLLTSVS